jgi:hypothetical protein
MQIFSFHLSASTSAQTLSNFRNPPNRQQVPGLHHMECLSTMTLGAPILSPSRLQLRKLAVFAAWESENALDTFMSKTRLGRSLSEGWQVRLSLIRRWGSLSELDHLPATEAKGSSTESVVAVTLARLKLSQTLRFIRWGRPVEKLVRNHPGTTLALAAFRPPRTFCTFSIWRSQQEMTDMVCGKGTHPGAERHARAMEERERKDFHSQFTTLRFRPVEERGEWAGRDDYLPG